MKIRIYFGNQYFPKHCIHCVVISADILNWPFKNIPES